MSYDTSIKDAARELGISVQATYKRIAAGTLQAQKINKHWLVDSASIQDSKKHASRPGRPHSGVSYLLMNGTYPVMEFSFDERNRAFRPHEVIDASRAPIGTVTRNGNGSSAGLKRWWEHRSIPVSRNGMDRKLLELGVDDPSLIPFRNLGFSLSDQYWIQPAGEHFAWGDLNYFQNDFGSDESPWDEWLSDVGLSSPDNTSEGALPKRWICEGERRTLLKGHIPWTDQQVYNEVVATALHNRILDPSEFVQYETRTIENVGVVSACACFINSDEEYVPASLIYDSEGSRKGETVYDAVFRQATNLGIPPRAVSLSLSKMIVCDSLLANTDRHLRNFGYIRNIHTLQWRFAPLFDSGNSLWYDNDEGKVAQNDHFFISRPFDAIPNRQLMLAARDSWFELALLDGFIDEAIGILANGNISAWRLDYLRKGLESRLDALRVIWS